MENILPSRAEHRNPALRLGPHSGTGRHYPGAEEVLTAALTSVADGINEVGCLSHCDPWGFVDLAGAMDHPLAAKIMRKRLPMVLRGQEADGGWGGVFDRSLQVFRALVRHDVLEPILIAAASTGLARCRRDPRAAVGSCSVPGMGDAPDHGVG